MKLKYILTAAVIAAMAWSCSDDKDSLTGEGQIMINPTINAELTSGSRSTSDELKAELSESLVLQILNSKGVVRQYQTLANVPTEPISLVAGQYTAWAWAGDSVSADYEKRYFKGETDFTVESGKTTTVDITCSIANVVTSVVWDSSLEGVLEDLKLDVGHSRARLDLNAEHDRIYFMMPSTDTDLTWTLTGVNAVTGVTITNTEAIANVQPGHEYIFKISIAPSDDPEIGGGILNIVVDDTTIDVDQSVKIVLAPKIVGIDFNIDEVQSGAPGQLTDHYVFISTSNKFTSIIVKNEVFGTIFGDSRTEIDLVGLTASARATLKDAGFDPGVAETQGSGEEMASSIRIGLSKEFLNTYFGTEGEYKIVFEASIENPYDETQILTSTKTLAFNVSEDPISIQDVDTSLIEFSHNQALLKGNILNAYDSTQPIYIQYRQTGDTEYKSVEATVSGSAFSALVTGLTPGTDYQFVATATRTDGTAFTTKAKTFTTEPATQLPNNSFEYWQTSSAPYLIYASGQEMFWDSGNHGSATMSKNVTVPDSDIKHSGTYSIKLASQFVGIGSIGKFAAGNVFIGEYLATPGTNGVLGWGREFTGRPTKLHGWVKYTPVAVTHTSSSLPDISKGDMDKGIIYMALLDDTLQEYNGTYYPQIVNTSTQEFFDSEGSNVIAYGEMVWEEATAGDDMVEFTITLDYKRTDIRPSYILCTASASKAGDYFVGGNGSNMWLDDLELIYE